MKNRLILCLAAAALSACALQAERPVREDKAAENIYLPKSPIYSAPVSATAGELAYTVERLARQNGCELYDHAELMSKRPGIEFYRVPCADGRNILYRCELRQCRVAE